jgi:hypothetical protein
MGELNSFRWVNLAVLAPGRSHYWSFDPLWDSHGRVFQATAYPEPCRTGANDTIQAGRVEVTELFIIHKEREVETSRRESRVNITVTNTGDSWARYTLWVASIRPRRRLCVGKSGPVSSVRRLATGTASRNKRVKILLVHDECGNLKSVAVPANKPDLRADLRPQRGELVTEVEVLDSELKRFRRNPCDIIENFIIDSARARLAPRCARNASD